MTIPTPSTLAAGLLLALAAGLAVAQTTPAKPAAKPAGKTAGKTLGGNVPGGGKLMTRDELRSCMQRLDEVNQNGKGVETQRVQLDAERDQLRQAGELLKGERAEVDRQLAAVREWEGRLKVHTADIEAFNKRNAQVAEAPRGDQARLADELKTERERLEKVHAALGVEETKLVPVYQASAKTYNERATAHDAKVSDWNARNASAADVSVKQQETRTLWLNECANRPYLEDDEKALKAGK